MRSLDERGPTCPLTTTALAARHRIRAFRRRIWALRGNVSSYDACYVALAEALGCPLLTADARLAKARGVRCPIEVA